MPFLAAIPIGAAIAASAGAGLAGSLISGKTQADASKSAAQLQAEQAANALDFQKTQYNTTQQQMQPYLQGGYGALSQLETGLGVTPQTSTGAPVAGTSVSALGGGTLSARPGQANISAGGGVAPGGTTTGAPQSALARAPGTEGGVNPTTGQPLSGLGISGGIASGSLIAPFSQQFQAPTAEQAAQYPGYQFQLQQGKNAIEDSAAARGGLVSGNTATALNNYSQGAAQSDYTNVYNQAMQEYLNSYNIYNQNQSNQYNRLASMAGLGQTTAQQLGGLGQSAASNVGNISMQAGQQQGQSLQNAGAATASGYAGATNAVTGALGSIPALTYLGLLGGQNNSIYSSPANYTPGIQGST